MFARAGNRFKRGGRVIRFWREIRRVPRSAEIAEASHNALTLKYLDGGHGKGAVTKWTIFTLCRRRFHHFTFTVLCPVLPPRSWRRAITTSPVGEAPYPFFSLPVMLGTLGGIGLLYRPGRATVLNLRRSPLHAAMRARNP